MSYLLSDYHCTACGLTCESLELRAEVPKERPCSCGGTAERCLSAATVGTKWGAADSTGESQKRPPWVADTSLIADGKSKEYRARVKEQSKRISRARVRQMIS